MADLKNNHEIMQACAALVPPSLLVSEERELLVNVEPFDSETMDVIRARIADGDDVLGDSYLWANLSDQRRLHGETYTPSAIVESMIGIAKGMRTPKRIVDAGCGSGRFSIAGALAFPEAKVIAVDASPSATIMCKANVCARGLQDRIEVVLGDFTTMELPECDGEGSTLWIGNPPYVRHHDISAESKQWLMHEAATLGVKASGLSGLHAYFVLSIAARLRESDFGVLVTSAEWLDVNYGSLVRKLLAERMGLSSLTLYDKRERVFQDADTTAVVFSFDAKVAGDDSRLVSFASGDDGGFIRCLSASDFSASEKWSTLAADTSKRKVPKGYVRLGDYARVHRGIVTGANRFWVKEPPVGENEKFTIPVVSHAREIMTGVSTVEAEGLSRLVVLPENYDDLSEDDANFVRSFIEEGKRRNVDQGYVAKSRKCWWSIPVGEPATILMTYMARRPPRFVANPHKVRSLNVVHGIYPTVELSNRAVMELVDYLNASVSCDEGRTYCGGLTKFEPREAEALWVPSPEMLEEGSWRS